MCSSDLDDVLVKAVVSVRGDDAPGGTVTVTEGRRTLDAVRLRPARHGRAVLDAGQLSRGVHVLQVNYSGDAMTAPSTSTRMTVFVSRYRHGHRLVRQLATAW